MHEAQAIHNSVSHGLVYYFAAFGGAALLGLLLCVADYILRKLWHIE